MKNLFIGNLSFQTTETELRALLEAFGQIGRVYMPRNRETGQLRGFAFVEMKNDDEAKKAIGALNGKDVRGRNVNVSEARPKEHSGPVDRRAGRIGQDRR